MRERTLALLVLGACGGGEAPADRPPDVVPDAPALPGLTFTTAVAGGAPANMELVALADGDGPFQAIAGDRGVYPIAVTGARYAVVAACHHAVDGSIFVSVGYYAVTDGSRFGLDPCGTAAPTVEISGTAEHASAAVFVGDGIDRTLAQTQTNFSLRAVPGPGILDGVAGHGGESGIVLAPVTFADGAQLAIDFSTAFLPASAALTVQPAGADLLMETDYIDPQNRLHHIDDGATGVSSYRVVPAGHLANGLSHLFIQAGGISPQLESLERAFRTPVDQTVALPTPLVVSAPTTGLEITIPAQADAVHYGVFYFVSHPDRVGTEQWSITYSPAYVGAGDVVSRVPDIDGFTFPVDGSRSWNVTVQGGSARRVPGGSPFDIEGAPSAPWQDGEEVTTASVGGAL